MKTLYIIKDENYPGWQSYEVYDNAIGRVVLQTEDWAKVVEIFGGNVPTPEVVEVG